MDLDDTTIQEDSFEYDDRDILYATAGKEGGRPVVVFYPLGSSRRCLSLVEDEALERGLWLICCNRPGHGTSRPPAMPEDTTAAAWQLDTAVEDVKHLLDELSIKRASLLFLCAGAPFALGFASKYPERTGKMLGIASWVSPADCEESLGFFRFASSLPSFALDMFGGLWSLGQTVSKILPEPPTSFITSKLEECEKEQFHSDQGTRSKAEKLSIARSEISSGGHLDLAVLMASQEDLDLDLPNPHNLRLIHSQFDEIIPIEAARWFSKELGIGLVELPANSHTGCLLMLNPAIPHALNFL